MTRLLEKYKSEIVPSLKEELGHKNVHAVPKLEKIVISMGVGEAVQDRKRLDAAVDHLTILSGQKAEIRRAKKSVSGFRLREGMPIGCRVTLRGKRMYEFLDRLITLALPRVRDFRGVNPKGFDGRGNYNCGLQEQLVFPEVDPETVTQPQGMNITIVTTATTNEEGHSLLKAFGMPFKNKDSDR
ncbi:50S ribosomal protein L5 [Fuerstiella marisgermanici]|uniref:Large ribosomal subunit protein uL5 n=1 Tax=Fuerstiella marisgermanici TaxID=1891926 RepID=A0A1P8WQ96_9PLAN|nr:50S ribosomal protein L5 [Fuerstiella marisgermanici]APZ96219.1 50S ribosomal protein L5 [Fuerstiella marisgermanici]